LPVAGPFKISPRTHFGVVSCCLVLAVDPNEFTRRQIECPHQKTSDVTQVLDFVTVIGCFVFDYVHGLIRFSDRDNVKFRVALALLCPSSNQPGFGQGKN
jgi:tRNA-binding EMAP/Myf-like protein